MRIPELYKKVLGIFAAQTPKLFGISAGFEADAVRTTGGVAHRYLQRHTGGAGHSGTVRQRDGAVHRRGDRRPAACARCRLRHGLAGYVGHLYQMQLQYQPYSPHPVYSPHIPAYRLEKSESVTGMSLKDP